MIITHGPSPSVHTRSFSRSNLLRLSMVLDPQRSCIIKRQKHRKLLSIIPGVIVQATAFLTIPFLIHSPPKPMRNCFFSSQPKAALLDNSVKDFVVTMQLKSDYVIRDQQYSYVSELEPNVAWYCTLHWIVSQDHEKSLFWIRYHFSFLRELLVIYLELRTSLWSHPIVLVPFVGTPLMYEWHGKVDKEFALCEQ